MATKRKFNDYQYEWLRNNSDKFVISELTLKFNDRFNTNFNKNSIINVCRRVLRIPYIPFDDGYHSRSRKPSSERRYVRFSQEMKEWLLAQDTNIKTSVMIKEEFNTKFNVNYTNNNIASFFSHRGIGLNSSKYFGTIQNDVIKFMKDYIYTHNDTTVELLKNKATEKFNYPFTIYQIDNCITKGSLRYAIKGYNELFKKIISIDDIEYIKFKYTPTKHNERGSLRTDHRDYIPVINYQYALENNIDFEKVRKFHIVRLADGKLINADNTLKKFLISRKMINSYTHCESFLNNLDIKTFEVIRKIIELEDALGNYRNTHKIKYYRTIKGGEHRCY